MTLDLRKYTPARVALGRAGSGLPTKALLDFQLAHAQARDAVHAVLDVRGLIAGFEARGMQAVALKSGAKDRTEYLRNPGLGRTLAAESASRLSAIAPRETAGKAGGEAPVGCDVVFILADGLSALAVDRHALPLIDALLPRLQGSGGDDQGNSNDAQAAWTVGPGCVVEQGRVAIGDGIGAAFGALFSVVLIGERPGLSSPDSLGVYLTWNPRPGRTDAERNCVSNIRPEGLPYDAAARRLSYLIKEGRRRRLTGVALKDSSAIAEALRLP